MQCYQGLAGLLMVRLYFMRTVSIKHGKLIRNGELNSVKVLVIKEHRVVSLLYIIMRRTYLMFYV